MIDHQDLTVYFIHKKVIRNTKRKEMMRVITPLWPLLSTKNEFLRDDVVHRAAFENAKRILASGRNITFFDLKSLMRIITDASQVGLLQKQHAEEIGRWSKPDHDVWLTRKRDTRSIIKLDMLAVAFAFDKTRTFVAGAETDYAPMVPILNIHRLDEIKNPRLQRLWHRLMPYQIRAWWFKGTDNAIADAPDVDDGS